MPDELYQCFTNECIYSEIPFPELTIIWESEYLHISSHSKGKEESGKMRFQCDDSKITFTENKSSGLHANQGLALTAIFDVYC